MVFMRASPFFWGNDYDGYTLQDGLNFGLGNKKASGVRMAISWVGREVSRFPAKSFLPPKNSNERKKFLPGTRRAPTLTVGWGKLSLTKPKFNEDKFNNIRTKH